MTTIQKHIDLVNEANKITNRKTLYAAGAGLIPFPILDAATLIAVQLTMVRSIGNLYGVEFKHNIAKTLIASVIGSVGSAGIGFAKLIPGIGTIVGATATSITGAASTFAIGKIFTHHFDQGGTLLDFDPISSREFFYKEYEAGQVYLSQQDLIDSSPEKTEEIKSEKARLVEETEALYACLVSLQQSIDLLQTQKLASKATSINTADLTIIEGIGPKTDAILKAAGIGTLAKLAESEVGRLQEILKAARGNFNMANPASWPEQAYLAATGKMDELMVLQDQLDGGRVKKDAENKD